MGNHALAPGILSLLVGGEMAQMGMDMEERERGWFERQRGLKASMGSIVVCKRGVSLRVTPHPPFIAFWGF